MLEFWLEQSLESWVEIPYTPTIHKEYVQKWVVSHNQNGISIRFSFRNSSQKIFYLIASQLLEERLEERHEARLVGVAVHHDVQDAAGHDLRDERGGGVLLITLIGIFRILLLRDKTSQTCEGL